MRCFKGEFAYHKVTWNHNFPDWKYLEDDEIKENDAVIISLPFSDYGAEHPETQNILDQCDRLNVPVLIDCAYYSIARDLNFNLDRKCIKVVTFSLSKAFWGTERLRVGIRCTREFVDDTVNFFTGHQMVAKTAAGIGTKLCNTFEADYNQNMFRDKQTKICYALNIKPSDCVIFGLADKSHEKFADYDRGTQWRRVCISKLLGEPNYE
jgi:alanine-alpha-ketoisovalerate/valine-pyruvate aminotransferase